MKQIFCKLQISLHNGNLLEQPHSIPRKAISLISQATVSRCSSQHIALSPFPCGSKASRTFQPTSVVFRHFFHCLFNSHVFPTSLQVFVLGNNCFPYDSLQITYLISAILTQPCLCSMAITSPMWAVMQRLTLPSLWSLR